jgi:hypothetical protein
MAKKKKKKAAKKVAKKKKKGHGTHALGLHSWGSRRTARRAAPFASA